MFLEARAETCVPEKLARCITAALTGSVCVHFFQKVLDAIEILMQSATVDFVVCSGPRLDHEIRREDGDQHTMCRVGMALTQNSRIHCVIPYLGI